MISVYNFTFLVYNQAVFLLLILLDMRRFPRCYLWLSYLLMFPIFVFFWGGSFFYTSNWPQGVGDVSHLSCVNWEILVLAIVNQAVNLQFMQLIFTWTINLVTCVCVTTPFFFQLNKYEIRMKIILLSY